MQLEAEFRMVNRDKQWSILASMCGEIWMCYVYACVKSTSVQGPERKKVNVDISLKIYSLLHDRV